MLSVELTCAWGSVSDEVSELGWPDLWDIILVVVPPVLLLPLVELGGSGGEEPGEGFGASNHDPEEEGDTNVTAHVASILRSTDEEGNEHPEGEHPGEWDHPGNGSVVDFLHDSVLGSLDVGEEPEGAKGTEGRSEGPLHNAESVPFSLGETPDADAKGAGSAWPPCLNDNSGECAHEPPEKSKPDGLHLVVLVEVGGVEDGHVSYLSVVGSCTVAHILIIKL